MEGVLNVFLRRTFFCRKKRVGKSSGGRPPILLDINRENGFSVGVEVGESHIDAVLLNLVNEMKDSNSKRLSNHLSPNALADDIKNMIDELVNKAHISQEDIISVGVGLPGIVSADQKRLLLSPNLKWKDVDMARLLEEKLNKPVFFG